LFEIILKKGEVALSKTSLKRGVKTSKSNIMWIYFFHPKDGL
jgi:hypothetical protein